MRVDVNQRYGSDYGKFRNYVERLKNLFAIEQQMRQLGVTYESIMVENESIFVAAGFFMLLLDANDM